MEHTSDKKVEVLFLDDEFFNLQSFRAAFRSQFKVHLAQTTQVAREILDYNEIEVIISDQRMPDQSGTEFFNEIIQVHPDPVRILLTGYVDIKAVIDAINKGEVYRFLSKPWNDEEVKITINNAAEIYRTRKELIRKNEMLEKAYNELDQFVYSASHDLRSPIASIKGVLQLIDLEPENKDEYISIIQQITDKMDKYVINIIHYYRSSRFEKKINEVDLKDAVEDLLDEFQYMPEASNVHINTHFQLNSPVYSDGIKIILILRNLIHNAIKYQRNDTDEKLVDINVKATEERISVSIKDNGVGINVREGDQIFKMFQRATNVKSGIGLGLFIVKQCVDKLDGEISFQSEEGIGTTFEIEIPNLLNLEVIQPNPQS